MNARALILIVAALLVTGGTIFFAKSWLDNQRNQVAAPAETKETGKFVLVANVDLPSGLFLEEAHVRWQAWPDKAIAESYYQKASTQPNELFGAVVRKGIFAGEPLTVGSLVKPGDRGFLAAVLRPGYRAVAVSINAKSGVAGLVFPGDRVDVLMAITVVQEIESGNKAKKVTRRAAETVLTNVRVLAVDQRVDDQNGVAKVAKTSTLEVTPKQAEMLSVAQQLGKLSFSLRSLAKDEEELGILARSGDVLEDPDPVRGETFTFDTQVSRVVTMRTKKDSVIVSRGGKTTSVNVK